MTDEVVITRSEATPRGTITVHLGGTGPLAGAGYSSPSRLQAKRGRIETRCLAVVAALTLATTTAPTVAAQDIGAIPEGSGGSRLAGGQLSLSGEVLPGAELTVGGAYLGGSYGLGLAQADLQFRVHPNITVGGGYFELFGAPSTAPPGAYDRRARFSVRSEVKAGEVTLRPVLLTEYLFRDTSESLRIRPSIEAEINLMMGQLKISPFVVGELIYDQMMNRLTAYQTVVGFRVPITERMKLQLYYFRQFRLGGPDGNTVGVALSYRFGEPPR